MSDARVYEYDEVETVTAFCTYCGAETIGGPPTMPPGHEVGLPCPMRANAPCPLCAARPTEPCVITDPTSVNFGQPTRPHAARLSNLRAPASNLVRLDDYR